MPTAYSSTKLIKSPIYCGSKTFLKNFQKTLDIFKARSIIVRVRGKEATHKDSSVYGFRFSWIFYPPKKVFRTFLNNA